MSQHLLAHVPVQLAVPRRLAVGLHPQALFYRSVPTRVAAGVPVSLQVTVSPGVEEVQLVSEIPLDQHGHYACWSMAGVQFLEMSPTPQPLRTKFPHAGHLIHIPTHIDVLL